MDAYGVVGVLRGIVQTTLLTLIRPAVLWDAQIRICRLMHRL